MRGIPGLLYIFYIILFSTMPRTAWLNRLNVSAISRLFLLTRLQRTLLNNVGNRRCSSSFLLTYPRRAWHLTPFGFRLNLPFLLTRLRRAWPYHRYQHSPLLYYYSHAHVGRNIFSLQLLNKSQISTHTPRRAWRPFPFLISCWSNISTHTPA